MRRLITPKRTYDNTLFDEDEPPRKKRKTLNVAVDKPQESIKFLEQQVKEEEARHQKFVESLRHKNISLRRRRLMRNASASRVSRARSKLKFVNFGAQRKEGDDAGLPATNADQSQIIEALRAENDALRAENNALRAENDALRAASAVDSDLFPNESTQPQLDFYAEDPLLTSNTLTLFFCASPTDNEKLSDSAAESYLGNG